MDYKIIELKSTLSTNSFAKELLSREKVQEGTVIYALEQISGRGHGNNLWESEAGKNLTFSLVLYPDFLAAREQFMITKVVSLGLIDFLKSFYNIRQIRIKWPNDIYAGLKKIAGVLIESDIVGSNIVHTITGIGLNLNQELFLSDAPNPVSVRNLIHENSDISISLDSVLYSIGLRYNQLREGEYRKLNSDYLENLLFYNKIHKYISGGNTFKGVITDVDQYGKLQILSEKGELRSFGMKEIAFVL